VQYWLVLEPSQRQERRRRGIQHDRAEFTWKEKRWLYPTYIERPTASLLRQLPERYLRETRPDLARWTCKHEKHTRFGKVDWVLHYHPERPGDAPFLTWTHPDDGVVYRVHQMTTSVRDRRWCELPSPKQVNWIKLTGEVCDRDTLAGQGTFKTLYFKEPS